ncbi:zinc-binding dehydrogenase [Streptomyces sp. NBC_01497]|uniref:zinc-binding dehydrogenase n=1 Tax=Streptomyces sp. NBC_01497 TaxID=2903885 RepID=UPI002E32723B|nr:zinc-binding dehydrogenase [Streptomyces sp. NBC_01497]
MHGQYVLVTGAVGAVGRAAVAAGARVIGTVRHEREVEAALAAGAHHVLRNAGPSDALIAGINDITAGRGLDRVADLAFDSGIAD